MKSEEDDISPREAGGPRVGKDRLSIGDSLDRER